MIPLQVEDSLLMHPGWELAQLVPNMAFLQPILADAMSYSTLQLSSLCPTLSADWEPIDVPTCWDSAERSLKYTIGFNGF